MRQTTPAYANHIENYYTLSVNDLETCVEHWVQHCVQVGPIAKIISTDSWGAFRHALGLHQHCVRDARGNTHDKWYQVQAQWLWMCTFVFRESRLCGAKQSLRRLTSAGDSRPEHAGALQRHPTTVSCENLEINCASSQAVAARNAISQVDPGKYCSRNERGMHIQHSLYRDIVH